ncbi:HesA/MoeB/ThiF family protein [Sporolactobacillus sp. CQH2019]|uniref:HesA/MoeB/ThiF family protein n=1 Tax=Sporolactobacillus sp. CQH2019 TaxID=3023512 RepID=UPI0023687EA2|nr:HesA/MoeB/ThiF family protein [Sporolactobacillus sp. CQH2019]MDD9149601.1 HesA/MoeB/ThiF family protein [Sporolactobacillus sp. CQH2019]
MDRYDRQRRVCQIGDSGQEKLKSSSILIVGCGALGSYAAEQLTRAGIKRLFLVDPDVVTLTNLQRQALFTEQDANNSVLKVEAAKRRLAEINAAVDVQAIPHKITAEFLKKATFNLVLDCSDNFSVRDLLNRCAIRQHFDYIFASCAGVSGNVMPISPATHPCLECVFPRLEKLKQIDCDQIGVNTALVPLVAALQVSLAIHWLVDRATVNFNQLLVVNNWSLEADRFAVTKRSNCPACCLHQAAITSSKDEVRSLCGKNVYSACLPARIGLADLVRFLKSEKISVSLRKTFVSFEWQATHISYFQSGKMMLYEAQSLADATAGYRNLCNALRKAAIIE